MWKKLSTVVRLSLIHIWQRIDLRTFSITDADYADFVEFMQDKEVPYESDTRRALKALKKAAEDDQMCIRDSMQIVPVAA